MRQMLQKTPRTKKYHPTDPAMKGKTLYILYQFDIGKDELMSDGPYLKKEEAYTQMQGFLKKGICAWVVMYNG